MMRHYLSAYVGSRILPRLVLLVVVTWGSTFWMNGMGVRSAGRGAVLYCVLIGFLQLLRFTLPELRVFLPERQGYGVASAAGLLYWGIGWAFPVIIAVTAFAQPVALTTGDKLILACAGTVGLWSAYALLIEPNWIIVRAYELPVPSELASLDGVRIVHVSDTHWRRPGRLVSRVVQRIRNLRPDVICLTGDLADDFESPSSVSVQAVRQFFQGLHAPYGTYVVLGDWDGLAKDWTAIERAMLESPSVHLLNDAICRVSFPDANVWILGRAPAHLGAMPDFMARLPKEGFRLVLHHYPFGAIRASEHGANLYLAGHTHGGQICLPWFGAFYPSTRGGQDRRGRTLPRRFNSGLHQVGQTWVHISSGLGTRGGDAPPIRFCCRPEIALLTLCKVRC